MFQQLTRASLAAVLVAAASTSLAFAEFPKHVAGKIVNVTHEHVKVNTAWLDQVTVTVDACVPPNQLVTVKYAPGTISDLDALGHLFDEDIHSAKTHADYKNQAPNGFGIFWLDQNDFVTRTGLLGYKMDCANVPDMLNQFK